MLCEACPNIQKYWACIDKLYSCWPSFACPSPSLQCFGDDLATQAARHEAESQQQEARQSRMDEVSQIRDDLDSFVARHPPPQTIGNVSWLAGGHADRFELGRKIASALIDVQQRGVIAGE